MGGKTATASKSAKAPVRKKGSATASTPTDTARHAQIKAMLEERRRQIMSEVRGRIRVVRNDSQNRIVEVESATQSGSGVQGDIEFALIQMKAETLKAINDALDRLDKGRYGLCMTCGEEIPEARLRELPFVVRCRDCEKKKEKAT